MKLEIYMKSEISAKGCIATHLDFSLCHIFGIYFRLLSSFDSWRGWKFPKSFCCIFFLNSFPLPLHFTISNKRKPGSISNTFLRNILSKISKFITYELRFPHDYSIQFWQTFCHYITRVSLSPIFNNMLLPFQPSPSAFLESKFLPAIFSSSHGLRFLFPHPPPPPHPLPPFFFFFF